MPNFVGFECADGGNGRSGVSEVRLMRAPESHDGRELSAPLAKCRLPHVALKPNVHVVLVVEHDAEK